MGYLTELKGEFLDEMIISLFELFQQRLQVSIRRRDILRRELNDRMLYRENLMIVGDLYGHVGTERTGCESAVRAFDVGADGNNEYILLSPGITQVDMVQVEQYSPRLHRQVNDRPAEQQSVTN